MDQVVRFVTLLRAEEGVDELAKQILVRFRLNKATMSKDTSKSAASSMNCGRFAGNPLKSEIRSANEERKGLEACLPQ